VFRLKSENGSVKKTEKEKTKNKKRVKYKLPYL